MSQRMVFISNNVCKGKGGAFSNLLPKYCKFVRIFQFKILENLINNVTGRQLFTKLSVLFFGHTCIGYI